MASHVVVTDSTARRHTIKTTPAKHLSDVLQEACVKFGVNPDQYALKHNNKTVDLSRTIRMSGLSSGARLDLIQYSRSPSVISVALQLPTEGGESGTLQRLTDKFPSNTPIWQILRRFEAGAAGNGTETSNHNFTQRVTPQMSSGTSGSGRLCYEMPVVNAMGRELGSFVELQKTLSQLGLNGGSCLLRLSYRKTEQPLEEAMTQISQYFKAAEDESQTSRTDDRGANGSYVGALQPAPTADGGSEVNGIAGEPVTASPQDTPMVDIPHSDNVPSSDSAHAATSSTTDTLSASQSTTIQATKSASSGVVIYAPPSSSTPTAASAAYFDESDYIPTVDHAKQHQALLSKEGRNRKLLSDAELDAQASARAAAVEEISCVTVRLRFPDQSQAQREYDRDATAAILYETCRDMMYRPNGESFSLRVAAGSTVKAGVRSPGGMVELKDSRQRLISDLGWQGRVLVTVVWGDDVTSVVKTHGSLRDEYQARAESLKVELPREEPEETSTKEQQGGLSREQSQGLGKSANKEVKMMKFLKGLSKK